MLTLAIGIPIIIIIVRIFFVIAFLLSSQRINRMNESEFNEEKMKTERRRLISKQYGNN